MTLPSGQKLHIEDNGFKATNDPLIFIHGLGGASTSFFPLLKASGLDESRRVIMVDWEGHGLSPLTGSEELTIEALARSYLDVMDMLNLEKAVVVGHSLGGVSFSTAPIPNAAHRNPCTTAHRELFCVSVR